MKRKSFYPKLALTNIKNNSKTYFPYIITCIGTILMFYNMVSLTLNSSTGHGSLSSVMVLGTGVTLVFSVIFIFYTNSFLVKRRKREFGLYNVLGMEKKHIGKVMFWENTIVATISIVIGLLLGILFSKFVTLLLYKLLKFDPIYDFEINGTALFSTILLFCGIFILTLLSSIWQVRKSKPLELLQSGSVGEKEPKSNWLIALLGVLTLGGGYYIALSVDKPLTAIPLFFVAVILVIIGTYCLFTSGSVVLLKLLRKNKAYYYKTKHFVSLSSMIYRMKKNAVGLANICIMSTVVLVMISTTVSMYIGMEDLMAETYPTDSLISFEYTPEKRPTNLSLEKDVKDILANDKMEYENFKGYEFLDFTALRDGDTYTANDQNVASGSDNDSMMLFISADDYEKLTGVKPQLSANEILIESARNSETIEVFGKTFYVKDNISDLPINKYRNWLIDTVYAVVSTPDVVDEMFYCQKNAYNDRANSIQYDIAFDFNCSDKEVVNYINDGFPERVYYKTNINSYCEFKQMNIEEFYMLHGGLFFLGIFLGFLFLIATVLIIYYKQIVEGYEDKERFRIMQNVGMSKSEVKKSINSQILTVFALPLLVAFVHILFAFPILTKLLGLLNLTNVSLFILCTIVTVIVFAAFYSLVYCATSKVYYKIIKG